MLIEAGFSLERRGTRHELWSNGTERVPISYGSKISPHTARSFVKILRRAKERLRTPAT